VKPLSNIFFGDSEKETWTRANDRCWALYEMGPVLGPQIWNYESGKTIQPGTIDRDFILYEKNRAGILAIET
jgi:hypothetical protein